MAIIKTTKYITIRKNSGVDVGTEQRLNLIEGDNVTLTVTDDPTNKEIDVTISSSAGGVSPVNPSITNNLVSFSNTTGSHKDSGYKISDLILGIGVNKITVGTDAPLNPDPGDLWIDTN